MGQLRCFHHLWVSAGTHAVPGDRSAVVVARVLLDHPHDVDHEGEHGEPGPGDRAPPGR
jgi:hypothetical protein